jgi:integrase/recombinase XerC
MRLQVLSDPEALVFENSLSKALPRDAAMIGLLFFCGLRTHEVCDLAWEDVFYGGFISHAIRVKTSHEPVNHPRLVDIPDKLKSLLEAHKRAALGKFQTLPGDGPLFRTLKQKGRILPRDLQRVCNKIALASIGKVCKPLTLRHTYATRLMRHANIRVVQELLGHRSLQSTQIYTHPTSDDCRQAVSQAFK